MSSTTVSAGGMPATLPGTSDVDAAYRKITWRLIPFIGLLWPLAWIDRINVGYVKLTMMADLQWSETVYGLGAGIFSALELTYQPLAVGWRLPMSVHPWALPQIGCASTKYTRPPPGSGPSQMRSSASGVT